MGDVEATAPVKFISRLGDNDGWASGPVAYFDRFDSKADRMVRHFVLMSESVKLMYEPWGWKNEWYVDIVRVERIDAGTIRLRDMYIDIIVEGDGPAYRIIDLDEFAGAIDHGLISRSEAAEALCAAQQFLDLHVHRNSDFPPGSIAPWLA